VIVEINGDNYEYGQVGSGPDLIHQTG
jgi:hypothetical protein